VLSEIWSGVLTGDEANTIVDDIIASPDASQVVERLGLSKKEYTAYLHGAPFDVIARWRYAGWPRECGRCGKSMDSDRYGWRTREEPQGTFILEHITCP